MDDPELDTEDELGVDDLELDTEDELNADDLELDTENELDLGADDIGLVIEAFDEEDLGIERFDEEDDPNIDEADENIELTDEALLEDEGTASVCAEDILERLDEFEIFDELVDDLVEGSLDPPPHATRLNRHRLQKIFFAA